MFGSNTMRASEYKNSSGGLSDRNYNELPRLYGRRRRLRQMQTVQF